MFKFERLEKHHIKELLEFPMNESLRPAFSDEHIEMTLENPYCYVAKMGDEVILCGGITKLWEGRGHVWLILSPRIKKYPVCTFRSLKRFIKALPFNRLELDNPCGFMHGYRRALMFGFELETPRARKYWPDGRDAEIFVWVRE